MFIFWIAWKWYQFTILSKFISPGGQRAITINKLKQQNRILKKEAKEMKKLAKAAEKVSKETKNTIPNFRNFAQEVSTEDYYNTLQELRGNNS